MCAPEIITIDGPAASGKSTVGKQLADDLAYLYFDTGVMYRAVTWRAIEAAVSMEDEAAITELAQKVLIDVQPPSVADGRAADVLVDGEDVTWRIRSTEVDHWVSVVAAYPGVRRAMTDQQRRIGRRGHVVMVGRDIGTVVLPEAGLKVYLFASVSERARRRYEERIALGDDAAFEQILDSMRRRDELDSTRLIAPLKAAEDAVQINSDGISVSEVLARIKALFPGCSS
jgi:cytidylate kinase